MFNRSNILHTAASLTTGDRNQAHGDPFINMGGFARLVNAYLSVKPNGVPLTEVDGAMIALLHKVSRVGVNPLHMDSYIDICGYGAIAGECATILNLPPHAEDETGKVHTV